MTAGFFFIEKLLIPIQHGDLKTLFRAAHFTNTRKHTLKGLIISSWRTDKLLTAVSSSDTCEIKRNY